MASMRALAFLVPLALYAQADWQRHTLPFRLEAGESAAMNLPGTMPGGAAVFDFDGDGLVDVFFPNGAPLPGMLKRLPQDCNTLLRNRGQFKFEDVTANSGLCGSGYATGAAVGDADNDGGPDIVVFGVRALSLYRNLGDGRFQDVTAGSGLDNQGRWAAAAAFADIDRDGDLDLFVANYVAWDPANEPSCQVSGQRDYCHPKYYAPLAHALFENMGDGKFADVSARSGIGPFKGKGMSVAVADFNGDGLPDFFVTNDRVFNQLFLSQGGSKYAEAALEWGVAAPLDGRSPSSMGAHAADFDRDGRMDLIYTALAEETFPLYRGTGTALEDAGTSTRLAVLSRRMSGWGVWFADADNDGWLDVFVARGGVLSPAGPRGSSMNETLALFLNQQGRRFVDGSEAAGFGKVPPNRHRAFIPADFDNDGCLDVLAVAMNAPAFIMRNPCGGMKSVSIRLKGSASNRDGIGAVVSLTTASGTQYQSVSSSGGYASSRLAPLHFGVGDSKAADVEVVWPSGKRQSVAGLASGKTHLIEEPK
jgi:hypothetical protein